jgi:hypothetical protein
MKEATHYSFVSGEQNILLTLWPADANASPLYLTLDTQRAYKLASHLKRLAELLEEAATD